MYLIDKISYNKNVIHPVEKFVFSLGSIIIVLLSSNVYTPCILFALMTLLIFLITKIKISIFVKLLSIPFLFISLSIITLIININVNTATELFSIKFFSLSISVNEYSLLTGQLMFIRAFASVICFYFLILTTPIIEIEYILKKIKTPQFIREMFLLIYRYIFVVTGMFTNIIISQKSRSGYSTISNRMNSIGVLASAVFVKTLVFGKKSYQALLARGYEGEIKYIDREYSVSLRNWIFIVIIQVLFITHNIWMEV